ncbi:NAD(P)/FAD-dependent oxidoreductase [Pseudomonas soli]|jgi:cation diffusion facilitator CzcD-associated flavoprotein CzcO|uniref:Predicted flavoprotein CzcO associated with the cation diffusion facilitator CzcD n=1 Tax=Pseudomonas soli TaxID=1306993 RepID=A0A1H9JGT6_9PSED|nr:MULTISPECIES: NAD(P)/FAD-dependent oxidoreductase [Pseudomonas]AUY32453.1 NAD(P)/FAD-dependent oxidoreductase [Pseudomonas sp. PONIH3]NBK40882.1 NAD(P)/FAD-dependent oxidoreductase [Pseudomonas soli]WJO24293.1 NAD(P)/FAD-dependent oxidoreductase [Pseudomonas soli]SEQ85999.1 Predicted flavoprotein CzcO associated with the cation diffusion facilitator CzcD [Pseudomonas soli]
MNHQHFDTLIIGAGLSGIGTACQLAQEFPERSMAILERRACMGGTWDLFRYPGIRSDSDMLSYGYKFRLWRSPKVLADGASIRRYIQDTARQHGLDKKIHYGVKITGANWCSQQRLWQVSAVHEASATVRQYSCKFLLCCTGYYNHDAGFLPSFPGEEAFKGVRVHPQHWPEDLDYTGKHVVVIGSGATAATLIPAMADKTGHITMLQRSPSYIYSLPSTDTLTATLSRIMPARWAYGLARKRNIVLYRAAYIACRQWPRLMRRIILSHVRRQVGPDADMRHFTPHYMPWDERLCAVPDGDLFKAIRSGRASIETDHIERFSESGIVLKSGKHLPADIIITATGLRLQVLGGMIVSVDGTPYPIGEQMTYKGVLLENLPNMAWIFGYTNVSWTLKVGLAAKYLCRLFHYMDEHDFDVVTPRDDACNALDDGIMNSMKSGYIQRDQQFLPRQGKAYPWFVFMHYGRDKKMLLKDPVEDPRLAFLQSTREIPAPRPSRVTG